MHLVESRSGTRGGVRYPSFAHFKGCPWTSFWEVYYPLGVVLASAQLMERHPLEACQLLCATLHRNMISTSHLTDRTLRRISSQQSPDDYRQWPPNPTRTSGKVCDAHLKRAQGCLSRLATYLGNNRQRTLLQVGGKTRKICPEPRIKGESLNTFTIVI